MSYYSKLKLYIHSKLSFLETIKINDLSSALFNSLCIDMNNRSRYSQSFVRDSAVLEKYFEIDIELILAGPDKLQNEIKNKFQENYGVTNSINTCLSDLHYVNRELLNGLVRPSFLHEYIEQLHEIIDIDS